MTLRRLDDRYLALAARELRSALAGAPSPRLIAVALCAVFVLGLLALVAR